MKPGNPPRSSSRSRLRARPSIVTLMLTAVFALSPAQPGAAQVTTRTDEGGKLLNAWFTDGTAAGLSTLTYENRDGLHSLFEYERYPQMHLYEPSDEERARKANIGPVGLVHSTPFFGNCSMAAPADKGGSLPRFYYVGPNGIQFLTNQYLNSNLYFYPEHMDYDAGFNGRGGWGDMYPANTPYLVISQGSSFTDKPFLEAFISTMASFRPEVQDVLIKKRLLIPTLQSIFRSSNRTVKSDEDYFTGIAHPVVFDGKDLDVEKMMHEAHAMTRLAIPPIVLLDVAHESTVTGGVDFFESDPAVTERLATTACAIARVFRGSSITREMVVSTRKSGDLSNRSLTFRWSLLQGDPDRVKIEPSLDGTEAKITVAWHPAIKLNTGITSHRVDIGVFASNGVSWSAPSIVSFFMLPNEERFYDAQGRLQEICYEAGNPDLGLPALSDLRWLAMGRRLASQDKALGFELLRQVMSVLQEAPVASRAAKRCTSLAEIDTRHRL